MATSNLIKLDYLPGSHNAALSKLMDGTEKVRGNIAQLLDRP